MALGMAALWALAVFIAFIGGWICELLFRRPEALVAAPRYWVGIALVAGAAMLIALAALIRARRSGKIGGWIALVIGLVVVS